MQKKSEKGQSDKKTPKLCCQAGSNGKPGRLYVRLGYKKQYLGYGDDPEHPPLDVMRKYVDAQEYLKNQNKYKKDFHQYKQKGGVTPGDKNNWNPDGTLEDLADFIDSFGK